MLVDGAPVATVYRGDVALGAAPPPVPLPAGGVRLDVLVENLGRVNYASDPDRRESLYDRKGIVGRVSLDGAELAGGWTARALPFRPEHLSAALFSKQPPPRFAPALFRGAIDVGAAVPRDTYVSTRGRGKGAVFINGFNLGRFWEAKGPQHALYVPAALLRPGRNEVVVLDVEPPAAGPVEVAFTDGPDFDYEEPGKKKWGLF